MLPSVKSAFTVIQEEVLFALHPTGLSDEIEIQLRPECLTVAKNFHVVNLIILQPQLLGNILAKLAHLELAGSL